MSRKDMTPEAREALRVLPFAKEAFETIRERLPEGTDFGLMVLVPGNPESRVIALTTDRDVVAPAVGLWVMDVLNPTEE